MPFLGVFEILGYYNKISQTGWLNKQQQLISHSSEGQKFKIRVPVQSHYDGNVLLGCRLMTSCITLQRVERGSYLAHESYWGTNLLHKDSPLMISSSPKSLSKAPPPDINSRGRVSTSEFGGNTNFQFITLNWKWVSIVHISTLGLYCNKPWLIFSPVYCLNLLEPNIGSINFSISGFK